MGHVKTTPVVLKNFRHDTRDKFSKVKIK